MDTVTTTTVTAPFGSVESLAKILRSNNPDRSLVDSRTLAIIGILVGWGDAAPVNLGYVRNALAAAELVREELKAAAS